MILIIFLSAVLLASVTPLFFNRRVNLVLRFNQLWMLALIIAVVTLAITEHHNPIYTFHVLTFNKISLNLALQFDSLTKVMMIFILTIGLLIYRYAQNYLLSDSTRIRFLSQFNIVLFFVILLVMSYNLLTAFIAWQLIGINLYLLLNHYHYDAAANRAAKKKFVINRIGDCCFLLAIILAYHTYSAASFSALQYSSDAGIICGLLFISVMTKCAQFPFHIWLLDTMETPTPVSALMHAGIINAGGVLLARISSTLTNFSVLAYCILAVGLLSAFLSINWMNRQPDTKKKLAYSTMGQMGYMLVQCSLGAFSAAIFHLISHGFYKASLFLNFGETLHENNETSSETLSYISLIKSLLISLCIFSAGFFIYSNEKLHIPLLMFGFIFITLSSLVVKVNKRSSTKVGVDELLYYIIIFLLLLAYLYFFMQFSRVLGGYEYIGAIPVMVQSIIVICLIIGQCMLWLSKKPESVFSFRDRTEEVLRIMVLNPLRQCGDFISNKNKLNNSWFFRLLFIVTIIFFCVGLVHSTKFYNESFAFSQGLILLSLLIGAVGLVIANRCLSIVTLIAYLIIFELAFANIALFDNSHLVQVIGYFHLITITPVIVMLYLLSRPGNQVQKSEISANRLPTKIFYLVFCLLLLIGIPGTASFISEFYLLSALIGTGYINVFLYIAVIILSAIVVMHSLQLYAFNEAYTKIFSQKITKRDHVIFVGIIIFNIFCGLFPTLLLHAL